MEWDIDGLSLFFPKLDPSFDSVARILWLIVGTHLSGFLSSQFWDLCWPCNSTSSVSKPQNPIGTQRLLSVNIFGNFSFPSSGFPELGVWNSWFQSHCLLYFLNLEKMKCRNSTPKTCHNSWLWDFQCKGPRLLVIIISRISNPEIPKWWNFKPEKSLSRFRN